MYQPLNGVNITTALTTVFIAPLNTVIITPPLNTLAKIAPLKVSNVKDTQLIITKIKCICNTGIKSITTPLCMSEKYNDLTILTTTSFFSTDNLLISI